MKKSVSQILIAGMTRTLNSDTFAENTSESGNALRFLRNMSKKVTNGYNLQKLLDFFIKEPYTYVIKIFSARKKCCI